MNYMYMHLREQTCFCNSVYISCLLSVDHNAYTWVAAKAMNEYDGKGAKRLMDHFHQRWRIDVTGFHKQSTLDLDLVYNQLYWLLRGSNS